MSILKEFREFAVKGNVVDLAIGLIIGAEFGKIITSLVNDIVMPPVGLLIGGVDFKNLFIVLKDGATDSYTTLADAQKAGAVTLNIGNFITTLITFTLVAVAVFMVVKFMNRLRAGVVKKEVIVETKTPNHT